jgi:dTDP-4-dehydrorhamnose 3,5-epimerase
LRCAAQFRHPGGLSVLFRETPVSGAFVIEPERRVDERGYFARVFCERELAERGLESSVRQINTGFSPRAGTLRGMHFQLEPHAEVKIVRCVRGAAFDVVLDLRRDSPTFARWYGIELTADNGTQLYLPRGTAHGYLTLKDDTELIYSTSSPYAAQAARGVRYDDPAFGIQWPAGIRVISAADSSWPLFDR